ncbi:collagen alpha-1(III) chain-like [Panthera pardus]|uniref:Collagen alpha-1(III) chain-like n=1 Tax=Panthera pardus TaxID=9691 RepID=A0A9W2V8T7_PANPR|nr:collagen alpha-1(III) chain-like [Panthera pardus]
MPSELATSPPGARMPPSTAPETQVRTAADPALTSRPHTHAHRQQPRDCAGTAQARQPPDSGPPRRPAPPAGSGLCRPRGGGAIHAPPAHPGQDANPTGLRGCRRVPLRMVCPSGAPRRLAALAVSVRGVGTPRLPSPRPASCPTLLPEAAGNPARGHPAGRPGRSPLPGPHPAGAPGSGRTTHRPGGRLGRARLLEGHCLCWDKLTYSPRLPPPSAPGARVSGAPPSTPGGSCWWGWLPALRTLSQASRLSGTLQGAVSSRTPSPPTLCSSQKRGDPRPREPNCGRGGPPAEGGPSVWGP